MELFGMYSAFNHPLTLKIWKMDNEKIVNILNELLTKNYDAERGYKEAAEKVQNISLKGYFENQSKNRYDFGHEIKSLISK